MKNVQDRKELKEAAKGLEQWFISQDISPTDAVFVIAYLLVMQSISTLNPNKSPADEINRLKVLSVIIEAAIKLEIRECLREEMVENVDKIKDPLLRALVEKALKQHE